MIVTDAKKEKSYEREPIFYAGGVMDEETRPLLNKAFHELQKGEAILVVFRLPKGQSRDQLLEHNIQEITDTNGWNYVSSDPSQEMKGQPMQVLVENLAQATKESRIPNI